MAAEKVEKSPIGMSFKEKYYYNEQYGREEFGGVTL